MMWNSLHFQDASSFTMKALTYFHDKSMTLIIFISIYVGWVISCSIFSFTYSSTSPYEGHELESIWTILPSLTLIFLALPSLHLLYIIEESENPYITMKVTGHQWYWSYDYNYMHHMFNFDSYEVNSEEDFNDFRLMNVNNPMVLPYGVQSRILITAADVLHSWAIPSLGIKADAIPGRLNQIMITPQSPGIYYGQCSEICGAFHSWMPITMEACSWLDWHMWASNPM